MTLHADSLKGISVDSLTLFLIRLGYRRRSTRPGRGSLFELPDGSDSLIVPEDSSKRDYAAVVERLIDSMVTERFTVDDVLAQIQLGQCDIIRHRVRDFDTKWGSAPFAFVAEAMNGLLELIRFTAAGLITRRRVYTDVPDGAKSISQAARLGQTEHGSFVLKCYCPCTPFGTEHESPTVEPFGRVVTRACIENLKFFQRKDAASEQTAPPLTVNANVAKAVAALRPITEFGEVTFSVRLAAGVTQTPKDMPTPAEDVSLSLNYDVFQRAALVERQLSQTERVEPERLFGYLTDLHMDPPRDPATINYEVTLQVRYGSGWRTLKVALLGNEYVKAMEWQRARLEVFVAADIDKSSSQWRVARLIEFRPVERSLPLFSPPSEEPS